VTEEHSDLLGHRRYWPVYEALAELGLPLCLHPGRAGVIGSSTPVGRPATYLEWHTLLPIYYQSHLVSLLAEGVFEHFPPLRLVLCEGGIGWLPSLLWRMEKNFKSLRHSHPWMKRLPSEIVFDHVRLTTQPIEEPFDRDHLEQMFDMIQAHKTLLYSSDFPHWDFDPPMFAVKGKLPTELRRRVLYENAAELYGLPPMETAEREAA
jgi:predicted TIM-barrel fold metal-dependent hydrolase